MDRGAWGATVHEVAGLDTTECTQHTQLCSHLTLLLAWNLDTLSADSPNRLPFPLLLPPPLFWAWWEWPGSHLLTCWLWREPSRLPALSTAPEAKLIWLWGGPAWGDPLFSSLGLKEDVSAAFSPPCSPQPCTLVRSSQE